MRDKLATSEKGKFADFIATDKAHLKHQSNDKCRPHHQRRKCFSRNNDNVRGKLLLTAREIESLLTYGFIF